MKTTCSEGLNNAKNYEAQMPTEWVNIHTWLGIEYPIKFKKYEHREAIIEIAPNQLSDYEKGLLKNLKLWIYEKRRKALKDILKKNNIPKSDGILDIQEKLFQY